MLSVVRKMIDTALDVCIYALLLGAVWYGKEEMATFVLSLLSPEFAFASTQEAYYSLQALTFMLAIIWPLMAYVPRWAERFG